VPLSLLARHNPLASAEQQLHVLANSTACPPFEQRMAAAGLHLLRTTGITVFQINVGKLCNQTCRHCHVDAGPDRQEIMTRNTAELCMQVLAQTNIPTADITGGAPELNPNFRWLVEQAKALDRHVIDRCNLSVLLLRSQADLADFLARHRVEVIASLPYFRAPQTDVHRGDGVFDKSIQALRLLNRLGYGAEGSGRRGDVPLHPLGWLGRNTLRLRLQPDARPACQSWITTVSARDHAQPARATPHVTDRHRQPLLRLHGRRWVVLRRCCYLSEAPINS
jgi:hypothetical protein